VKNVGTEDSESKGETALCAAQVAALPYRLRGGLEFLLITSRETGRWVLPKGWPMGGKMAHVAAAREALEEAGVKGTVGKSSIGAYDYGKRLADGSSVRCVVDVYPLEVSSQAKRWREKGQRRLEWLSPREAADRVEEAELAELIERFAASFSA
jgi:8-oxo-dGTP pyrophosphatase MutT (NUDIX family)